MTGRFHGLNIGNLDNFGNLFGAQLSTDEQKARFNLIGRISPAEAPRGETKSGG